MEIIRGSLEDISRPSSSEQSGSRKSSMSLLHNDRKCAATPSELVVLTSYAADNLPQNCFDKAVMKSSDSPLSKVIFKDQNMTEVTEDENENSELQKAFEKMKKLDEILSLEVCKEKEIQRQRKELREKLWEELQQNRPKGYSECANEALNTKLFLALEADTGTEEKQKCVSLFETEVPDSDQNGDTLCLEKKDGKHALPWEANWTESFEAIFGDVGDNKLKDSLCEGTKCKNTQKNFIKRNIELVSGEMLLTCAEKERLDELLRQIDEEEEEEDNTKDTDSEDSMRAVSVLTGHGYTPEPSDLEKLIDIDSKIHVFHPVEEYQSIQSSYTNMSQVGWKCDGDWQPGEKVLQDIKERREQELRLHKIQQQLEILESGQEMTNESPQLTEEQLLTLLEECELTERWIQNHERNGTS